MLKSMKYEKEIEYIKTMFCDNVELVLNFGFGKNRIMLFDLFSDLTYADILKEYNNIKELFVDFDDITIEKENFFCEGFWIKLIKYDEFDKMLDDLDISDDSLDFPVCWGVATDDEIKEELSKNSLDEYFKDAVKLVMKNGNASVAYLQRMFSIGYSRAARMIDMMTYFGFIDVMNEEKNRKVLITPEKFKEFFSEDFV